MDIMTKIADGKELCSILNIKKRTLQNVWQEYPHFFVATGRDLRSARFDVEEVIEFLKARDYSHEHLVQKKSKGMDLSFSHEQGHLRGKWLPDKKCGGQGRTLKKKGTGGRNCIADPYGFLS
jgi:phage terminase Nu1 subunit (DNA packaging protein)